MYYGFLSFFCLCLSCFSMFLICCIFILFLLLVCYVFFFLFFFFKQKTAYEMRISYWSSDVCSSDLAKALTIALDAMGGDAAPQMGVRGAATALERFPDVRCLMVGRESEGSPLLGSKKRLLAASDLRHTDDVVSSDAKPSVALRAGRNSSMRLAIDAVRDGDADCVVSAGYTGALMAMAKFVLKTLPGINRPAIASFFPTLRGASDRKSTRL